MSWITNFFTRGVSGAHKQKLKPLEDALGYRFADLALLKRALTHKSYTNEKRASPLEQNERYEFLGDAVLELSITNHLMEHFPEFSEGELSKLRSAVVNEKALADLARRVQLGQYLYLGRGEDQCQGRDKDSLLSDAYEAVLGAIYLDRGFKRADQVVYNQFIHLLEEASHQDIIKDYKTKLQEEAQNRFKTIPRYRLVTERGPDHDKLFSIELSIRNEVKGHGVGKTKKQAEQNAAKQALDSFEQKS